MASFGIQVILCGVAPAQQQTPAAATVHLRTGLRALNDGNPSLAVRELQNAVRLAPEAAEGYVALSAAYLASGSYPYAWRFARQGYQLDKRSPRAAEQLAVVGMATLSQGNATVGLPSAEVKARLGGPDRINTSGSAQRWIYGCMAVDLAEGKLFSVVDLRGFDPALQQSSVRIAFRPDDATWRVRDRRIDRLSSTTNYESFENADDLLVVQRLYRWSKPDNTLRDWLDQRSKAMRQSGVDSERKILTDDGASMMFASQITDPKSGKSRWEITRLLKGNRDLFRVTYVTDSGAENLVPWKAKLQAIELRRP